MERGEGGGRGDDVREAGKEGRKERRERGGEGAREGWRKREGRERRF